MMYRGRVKVQNVGVGGNIGHAKIRHMLEMLEISKRNIVKIVETWEAYSNLITYTQENK